MEHSIITPENLSSFAFHTGDQCVGKIKGIVLDFHGLGFTPMMEETPEPAKQYGAKGGIYVFPYYGPWSWMNTIAVKTVDQIVAAIRNKYNLSDSVPVIATGGSMGGLSALVYTRYAEITPAACAAVCPVCDLPYHYTERADLPRTIYHAFFHYDCDFQTAMKSASPVHLAREMPDIPYYILHGNQDSMVNKEKHSDRFVAAMLESNHRNMTYKTAVGMEHCMLSEEDRKSYDDFIIRFLK